MIRGWFILQINFDLSNDELTHFSQGAKKRLTEQAKQYTLEIISESNKVEEMLRENGASQEITESIVVQAIRRNKTVKKKKIGTIILKILSEILLFISGLSFFPDKFIKSDGTLNMSYFIFFLILITASIIITIIMHFKDGE